MRYFAFLITDFRTSPPTAKIATEALEAVNAVSVHDMVHKLLDDWQEANGTDLPHVCTTDPDTDTFSVDLLKEKGSSELVLQIAAQRIEVYEDVRGKDMIREILSKLTGGNDGVHVFSTENAGDIPEEIRSALLADPDLPDEMRAIIETAVPSGAPAGVTKH